MNEYQAKGAYGVVMNCNTGAVLAMSSLPDYDCNEPYKLTYSKDKKAIKKLSKISGAILQYPTHMYPVLFLKHLSLLPLWRKML